MLDTDVLVDAERSGTTPRQLFSTLQKLYGGGTNCVTSAMTVYELMHGVHRSRDERTRAVRKNFLEEIRSLLVCIDVTADIAALGGEIDARQTAAGRRIAVEDVIIAATAIFLNFSDLTFNEKRFEVIPGLSVVRHRRSN